jgi:hypothetical protein
MGLGVRVFNLARPYGALVFSEIQCPQMPAGKSHVANRVEGPEPGKSQNAIFLLQNFMQLV